MYGFDGVGGVGGVDGRGAASTVGPTSRRWAPSLWRTFNSWPWVWPAIRRHRRFHAVEYGGQLPRHLRQHGPLAGERVQLVEHRFDGLRHRAGFCVGDLAGSVRPSGSTGGAATVSSA